MKRNMSLLLVIFVLILVSCDGNGTGVKDEMTLRQDGAVEEKGSPEGAVLLTSGGPSAGGIFNEDSFAPLDSYSRVQVIAAAVGIFLSLLCLLVAAVAGGLLIYRSMVGR